MPSNPNSIVARILSTNHRLFLESHLKKDLKKFRGVALVLGAGHDPYRHLLQETSKIITNDIDETLPNIDLLSTADQLDLEDSSVDAIVAIEVLEHVPDVEKVLRECQRVLTTGGKIYIAMPAMYHIHGDPDDYRRLTKSGLRQTLGDNYNIEVAKYYGNLFTVILDSLSSCHPIASVLRPLFRLGLLLSYTSNKFPSGVIVIARKK